MTRTTRDPSHFKNAHSLRCHVNVETTFDRMQIIQITNEFLCYQFPARPDRHFGFNIHALIDRDRALLIDTGFEDHAESVRSDLQRRGIKPVGAIISHFHDDHIFGLKALPKMDVYGSPRYGETLDREIPDWQDRLAFQPSRLLSDDTRFSFGGFTFRFLVMPGHAACNVYTLINDDWIHVGDDIMLSNQGEPLLASVEGDRLGDHIDSLNRLRDFSDRTFLLAHGTPIRDATAILSSINNRISYLQAVQTAWPSYISIEQAIATCDCDFLHKNWHEAMYL